MTSADITRLFLLLAAAYGGAWTRHFEDEAAYDVARNEWHRHLKRFTVRQLLVAHDQLLVQNPRFPPTLGQYLARLRPAAPYHRLLLPEPEHHNDLKGPLYLQARRVIARLLQGRVPRPRP